MSTYFKKRIIKPFVALAVVMFLGGLAVFANPVKTMAADAIGSSTIETASPITPGQYNGPALEFQQAAFYKITVKAGQELKIVGNFTPARTDYGGTLNTIRIYDQDRVQLVDQFEGSGTAVNVVTATTLASSAKETQTYYIEVTDDAWGTSSSTLDISLTDRYDAESNTDAGQTIETAMAIQAGRHTGYLSQVDTDDYFSVPAASGKFSIKVIPNGKMQPMVEIYDQDRTILSTHMAQNVGEIFTLTADVAQAGNVFVHISCDSSTGCVDEAREYVFATSISGNGDVVENTATDGQSNLTTAAGAATSQNNNNLWIALGILGVIVVIVIVAVVVSKRKKGQANAKSLQQHADSSQTSQPINDETNNKESMVGPQAEGSAPPSKEEQKK